MKKIMAKKIKYRLYPDMNDKGTLAIRSRQTGKFLGRRVVRKGEKSDKTYPLRVSGPKDYSGQIMGRTSPIAVKGSSHSRGYTRSML